MIPISLEQLQSFNPPALSRNPILHYVFARMQLAEERGLGLRSLKKRAEELSQPFPTYEWNDPYLVLKIYRNSEGFFDSVPKAIVEQLSKEERLTLIYCLGKNLVTKNELTNYFKIPPRTTQRHLAHLVDLGVIEKIGGGPSTQYRKMIT